MNSVASVLSAKLSRIGRKAGAFFVLASAVVIPAIARAVTGPASDQPAVVTGLGRVVDGDTLDVGQRVSAWKVSTPPRWPRRAGPPPEKVWECGKVSSAFLRTLSAATRPRLRSHRDRQIPPHARDVFRGWHQHQRGDGSRRYGVGVREVFERIRHRRSRRTRPEDRCLARRRRSALGFPPARMAGGGNGRRRKTARSKAISHPTGMIYHMPWSPWYDRVRIDDSRGERWFCSEAEALAAGWRPVAAN